jgi:hypothetical protein
MAWFGAAVASVVTAVVVACLFIFVITPIAIISRVLGRDPLASQPDGMLASYWERVVKHPTERLYEQQFAYDAGKVDTRRARGGRRLLGWAVALVILAVVNFAIGIGLRAVLADTLRHQFAEDLGLEERGWDYAASWKKQYERESELASLEYAPFFGWRGKDFSGEHINIQDHVRRTSRAAAAEAPTAIVVWCFGGSTMWGEDARDAHTIPSELAAIAEGNHLSVRVTNFAERGFNVWQELMRFETLLATEAPPDVVVFYDGVNELGLQKHGGSGPDQYASGSWRRRLEPPWELDQLKRWMKFNSAIGIVSDVLAFRRDPVWGDDALDPEKVSRDTAAVYNAAVGLLYDITDRRHIRLTAFWQPSLFTKKTFSAADQQLLQRHFPHYDNTRRAWALTANRLDPRVKNISDALDAEEQPIYTDEMHVNELANRVIAQRIYQELEGSLKDAAASRTAAAKP